MSTTPYNWQSVADAWSCQHCRTAEADGGLTVADWNNTDAAIYWADRFGICDLCSSTRFKATTTKEELT